MKYQVRVNGSVEESDIKHERRAVRKGLDLADLQNTVTVEEIPKDGRPVVIAKWIAGDRIL